MEKTQKLKSIKKHKKEKRLKEDEEAYMDRDKLLQLNPLEEPPTCAWTKVKGRRALVCFVTFVDGEVDKAMVMFGNGAMKAVPISDVDLRNINERS